jgi:hypothetical protein
VCKRHSVVVVDVVVVAVVVVGVVAGAFNWLNVLVNEVISFIQIVVRWVFVSTIIIR